MRWISYFNTRTTERKISAMRAALAANSTPPHEQKDVLAAEQASMTNARTMARLLRLQHAQLEQYKETEKFYKEPIELILQHTTRRWRKDNYRPSCQYKSSWLRFSFPTLYNRLLTFITTRDISNVHPTGSNLAGAKRFI